MSNLTMNKIRQAQLETLTWINSNNVLKAISNDSLQTVEPVKINKLPNLGIYDIEYSWEQYADIKLTFNNEDHKQSIVISLLRCDLNPEFNDTVLFIAKEEDSEEMKEKIEDMFIEHGNLMDGFKATTLEEDVATEEASVEVDENEELSSPPEEIDISDISVVEEEEVIETISEQDLLLNPSESENNAEEDLDISEEELEDIINTSLEKSSSSRTAAINTILKVIKDNYTSVDEDAQYKTTTHNVTGRTVGVETLVTLNSHREELRDAGVGDPLFVRVILHEDGEGYYVLALDAFRNIIYKDVFSKDVLSGDSLTDNSVIFDLFKSSTDALNNPQLTKIRLLTNQVVEPFKATPQQPRATFGNLNNQTNNGHINLSPSNNSFASGLNQFTPSYPNQKEVGDILLRDFLATITRVDYNQIKNKDNSLQAVVGVVHQDSYNLFNKPSTTNAEALVKLLKFMNSPLLNVDFSGLVVSVYFEKLPVARHQSGITLNPIKVNIVVDLVGMEHRGKTFIVVKDAVLPTDVSYLAISYNF